MIFDFSFFVFNQIESIVIDSVAESERERVRQNEFHCHQITKNTISKIAAGNILNWIDHERT